MLRELAWARRSSIRNFAATRLAAWRVRLHHRAVLRSRVFALIGLLFLAVVMIGGCAAIAGVSDFAVDPCFDPGSTSAGCADAQLPVDGSRDTSSNTDGPGPDPDGGADVVAPRPASLADSLVTLSSSGVAVGKTVTATLTARDNTGDGGAPLPGIASKVVFTMKGGTSVVSFGAVTDTGGGTYTSVVTGVTEGTPLDISATIDAAALATAPAKLEVGRVTTGLTFALDAANADRAGNFGGKGCPAAGLTEWTDLTASAFAGTLTAFNNPCTGSGWAGIGTSANPYRLTFDGVDDHVDFGTVNALQKHTVLAWIRKSGAGLTGTSGSGGLTNVTPILAKGTAEGETDAIDINYYLGISSTGALATDYEASPGSGNAPLIGGTLLADNAWYMVGTTFDAAAATRSLYVNAAVDGTLAPALPPSGAASSLLIIGGAKRTDAAAATCPAGSTGCGRFSGDIALVLTYDRALTKAEIERNCHTFKSRFAGMTCPN